MWRSLWIRQWGHVDVIWCPTCCLETDQDSRKYSPQRIIHLWGFFCACVWVGALCCLQWGRNADVATCSLDSDSWRRACEESVLPGLVDEDTVKNYSHAGVNGKMLIARWQLLQKTTLCDLSDFWTLPCCQCSFMLVSGKNRDPKMKRGSGRRYDMHRKS